MNLFKKNMKYEEIKDIFYKSDFFNWSKDDNLEVFKDEDGIILDYAKENFFSEMSFIYKDRSVKLSPVIFLHGKCDEFAIALAKKMNYRVGVVYEFDEATGVFTNLIHAYCVKDNEHKSYNIDVRGVCPDDVHIVCDDEFEYSYDYSAYDVMDVEDAISFFEENMNDCRKVGHYNSLNNEALEIIEMFNDKFTV